MEQKSRIIKLTNGSDVLELPVNPQTVSVSRGVKVNTVNIIGLGDVFLPGDEEAITLSFSTFIPDTGSRFFQFGSRLKNQNAVIALLEKWITGKKVVQCCIGSYLNKQFYVTKLEKQIREGTKDVNVTITLSEYRQLVVKKPQSSGNKKGDDDGKITYYVVKKGDTLWELAKKYYGSGTKWKVIADKNGVKNPRNLQIGTKLIIPKG